MKYKYSIVYLLLVIFCACINTKAYTPIQNGSMPTEGFLEKGSKVQKELKLQEKHSYKIKMLPGEFLDLIVEQHGIDVIVSLFDETNNKLLEMDSPNGNEGIEPAYFISEKEGIYKLEITTSQEDSTKGTYQIVFSDLRLPTAKDKQELIAQQFFLEGQLLLSNEKKELKELAIEKFSEAVFIWEKLGNLDRQQQCLSYLVSVYNSLEQLDKSLQLSKTRLKIIKSLNDKQGEVGTLNDLAQIYSKLGQYEKAIGSFKEALTILDSDLKNNSIKCIVLSNLGTEFFNKRTEDSYKNAIITYKELLPLLEDQNNKEEILNILDVIGTCYFNIGDSENAIKYYNLALSTDIDEKNFVKLSTLYKLGVVYKDLGKYDESLKYYQKTLFLINEKGENTNQLIELKLITKISMSDIYSFLGKRKETIEILEENLVIAKKIKNEIFESQIYSRLGIEYNYLGDYEKALASLNKALDKNTKDESFQASTLNSIGSIYNILYQNEKAVDYQTKALSICGKIPDIRLKSTILSNLSLSYVNLQNYDKALNFITESLKIKISIGDKLGQASAIGNIASIYFLLGEYERSIEYNLQAMSLNQELKDITRQIVVLYNIGDSYKELRNYKKSLEFYERALLLITSSEDKVQEGKVTSRIGLLYTSIKEYDKALEYLNKSLSIGILRNDKNAQVDSFNNLGQVCAVQNKNQEALEFFQKAIWLGKTINYVSPIYLANAAETQFSLGNIKDSKDFLEEAISLYESGANKIPTTDLKTSYFSKGSRLYDLGVDLYMKENEISPNQGIDLVALQFNEQSRNRGMVELILESNLAKEYVIGNNLLLRKKDLSDRLATLSEKQVLLSSKKNSEKKYLEAEINNVLFQLDSIDSQIRQENPKYFNLSNPVKIRVEQIQSIIDDDTLLLDYGLGINNYYLWVISKKSIKGYTIGKAEEIDSLALEFITLLRDNNLDKKQGLKTEKGYYKLGEKLGNILLEPAKLQMHNKRLLIVADGILTSLPFGALLDIEQGNNSFLVLNHEISYSPSISTIISLRQNKRESKPEKLVAVIADPVFNTNDSRLAKNNPVNSSNENGKDVALLRASEDIENEGIFQRLPYSGIEGKTILSLAPKFSSLGLFGFEANLEGLTKVDLNKYQYIHFATHGIINYKTPDLSGLILSLVDKEGNERTGFLTTKQIFQLKLNSDLVVLSACKTALGKGLRREGVMGLTRAFIYAGTRQVMTSLWSISDKATSELMSRFYKHLIKDKMPPVAALRQAQISILQDKKWESPFYWAAFQLQGDWQ